MSKTEMQLAVNKIIDIYHRYSNRSTADHPDKLSKQEFKKMIEDQFPNCIKTARNPQGIEKLFKDLDKNKDQAVDFKEFMTLLGDFIECTHEGTHDHDHGHGHGHSH